MPRTALATLVAFLLLAAPAAAKLPALHAESDPARGGRVVDAHGREVLLRGVELAMGTADLRVLQATGWNLVRVKVAYDPATLARAERVVDALADAGLYSVISLPELPAGLTNVTALVKPFAGRDHVAGFEGLPVPGKLLFNPILTASATQVLTPPVASADGLQAARDAGRGAPVLVSWRPGADAVRMQDAQSGLRLGSIADQPGRIDPRGPLARAYVRAAPGRLGFTHYEDRRGHFAARGEAPRGTRVPVEVFYPQAKHPGAKLKARGLRDVRAHRLAGGGRLIWGTPTGRWSLQIGQHVKK
jgi:hypothetical protein